MNYDLKSKPAVGAGPNSPINDICAPTGAHSGSATSAVDAWTAAGMPHNQILLGVPAYGHSYVIPSTEITTPNVTRFLYPPYDLNLKHPGDRWDGDGGLDVCGVMQGPGGTYTYWGLMERGFLNQDGSVKQGIDYRFDECSKTVCAFRKSIIKSNL